MRIAIRSTIAAIALMPLAPSSSVAGLGIPPKFQGDWCVIVAPGTNYSARQCKYWNPPSYAHKKGRITVGDSGVTSHKPNGDKLVCTTESGRMDPSSRHRWFAHLDCGMLNKDRRLTKLAPTGNRFVDDFRNAEEKFRTFRLQRGLDTDGKSTLRVDDYFGNEHQSWFDRRPEVIQIRQAVSAAVGR